MEIIRLIQSCQKQNRKSQKEFYLLFADRLMNVSLRYTNDTPAAKDVLQNAFVKIFKNLHQFDVNRGTIDNWLTRIVINEALQYSRKQKRFPLKEIDVEASIHQDKMPNVLSMLQAEDLIKIVQSLPDIYRNVFFMYEIEGYKHRDIARQLGITESSSRSQLTRAKVMLRALIEQQRKIELC